MRKNPASVSALLIVLLVSSYMANPTQAANYSKIGVKSGDTANYSINMPDNPAAKTMSLLLVNVFYGIFQLNLTYHLADGGSYTTEMWGDISGHRPNFGIWQYLIVPGLQKGDAIFNGSSLTVSETKSMMVVGLNRTVNVLNYTAEGATHVYYWDQQTGIMVQTLLYYVVYRTSNYNITLLSTTAVSNPTSLIIPIIAGGAVAAAIIAGVVILIKRRR